MISIAVAQVSLCFFLEARFFRMMTNRSPTLHGFQSKWSLTYAFFCATPLS